MPGSRAIADVVATDELLLASTAQVVGLLAAALVLIGIALAVVAIRLVRATRTDHVALGPLEVLGDGSWRRHDPARRAQDLARARPAGAQPLPGGGDAGVDVVPVLPIDVLPGRGARGNAADEIDRAVAAAGEPDGSDEPGVDADKSEWAAPVSAATGEGEPLQPPPPPQPGPLEPEPAPPLPDPVPEPVPHPAPLPDPMPEPLPPPAPEPEPLPEPQPHPAPIPEPEPEPIPEPGPGPIPAVPPVPAVFGEGAVPVEGAVRVTFDDAGGTERNGDG